jgi:hypothetical protein
MSDEPGYKEANTAEEIMALDWDLDKYGYYTLNVRVGNKLARVFIEPRPNYCDRGHWFVNCEYFTDEIGINSIDRGDCFPRPYMSLDVAKSETLKFIVWRALKQSEGSDELFSHNNDKIQRSFDK